MILSFLICPYFLMYREKYSVGVKNGIVIVMYRCVLHEDFFVYHLFACQPLHSSSTWAIQKILFVQ
jgi:hypothetical protein